MHVNANIAHNQLQNLMRNSSLGNAYKMKLSVIKVMFKRLELQKIILFFIIFDFRF